MVTKLCVVQHPPTRAILVFKMLLSVAIFIQQLHWLVPTAVMFGTAPCFLMLWWPARIVTAVLPKRCYRRVDDLLFSSYVRMVLFFFENCTGVEVVLYGEVDALLNTDEVENAVYISNHQSTVDWIIGCSLALRGRALGRCRYLMKDGLKYFPVYGFYLSQHDSVFIKRAGKFQAGKAEQNLRNMVKNQFPMWMTVFPEGTRFNPELKGVIKKSQGYCRQQGIPELQNVLCPRTKATQVCLEQLADYAPAVMDVTIAYSNTQNVQSGERVASPGMIEFLSGQTKRVHIHVNRIPMTAIPKGNIQVTEWLFACFQFKEKILSHFYSFKDHEKAVFPGEGKVVPLSFKSTLPSFVFWAGSIAAVMAFKETRSLYWKTGAFTFVIGLVWVSVKSR